MGVLNLPRRAHDLNDRITEIEKMPLLQRTVHAQSIVSDAVALLIDLAEMADLVKNRYSELLARVENLEGAALGGEKSG